jgi:hypothetical protein
MQALSLAFTQFFATLAVFFSAFEKFGKTIDNIATVAEESSGAYVDEARSNRQTKLLELNEKLATQQKRIAKA